MELFLDLWAFLFLSLIEVIRLSHLLIDKRNLVSKTCIQNELMNSVNNNESMCVETSNLKWRYK